ncbi:hypothetical protein ABPG72_015252 [Tetrahymena utriculariae]
MRKNNDGIIEMQTSQSGNSSPMSKSTGQFRNKTDSGQHFYSTSQSMTQSNSSKLFACPNIVGMSQYVSASSLRHASPQISFSKQDRFPELKSNESTLSQRINLPSTNSPKSCTFGFGKKHFIPQHVLRNAKENPSPNHYQSAKSNSPLNTTHHGRSFGIPFHYYYKTYIPGYRVQCTEVAKDLPGVGQYEITKEPGKDKLKFSLFGKPKNRNYNSDFPACNHYNPNPVLELNARYTKLTFGKGNKYDFTKQNRNINPGPGTYKLPSPFDKFSPLNRNKKDIRRTAFI